jgi:hypothetical protein
MLDPHPTRQSDRQHGRPAGALLLSPKAEVPYRDGFWTRVAAAGNYEMPTDLRKVAHLGSRVETTPERAREVIVYLSEVHEFDLMLVEVVDDAGQTTHV